MTILRLEIYGFSPPYRYRDSKGGGIMLYIREDIPSKIFLLATDKEPTESLSVLFVCSL